MTDQIVDWDEFQKRVGWRLAALTVSLAGRIPVISPLLRELIPDPACIIKPHEKVD